VTRLKYSPDLHERCHQAVCDVLKEGGIAIDATAGNGVDTCCLAKAVGVRGKVYAFDIQTRALDQARARAVGDGVDRQIEWILAGHEFMSRHVPGHAKKKIQAIMFNLGYLPGGDHQRTTQAPTTISALNEAADLLASDGIISIMVYHGHPEGEYEKEAITVWLEDLEHDEWDWFEASVPNPKAPNLYLVRRKKREGLK